jgi:thioredoxin 1
MADTLTLTEDNFQAEVLDSSEPVLVDVAAAWCAPCRALEPIVEQLAAEYAGRVKVARIDADDHPQTVARYQVRGLPTLLFFKDGEVVDAHVGLAGKAQLAAKLDTLAPGA